MKTKLLAVILSATLLANPVASFAGGIPTIDLSAVASWANQAKQMEEQILNVLKQIEQQKQHLDAIRGARGLGKSDAILDALEQAPDEWAGIYKDIQAIDPTKTLKNIQIDPEREIKNAEQLRKDALQDYNKVSGIFKDLENIAKDIKAGKVIEPKDAQDIANRIQLNTAIITAMNAKYDMMKRQLEQEERLQSKKIVERDFCVRAAKNKTERNKCFAK